MSATSAAENQTRRMVGGTLWIIQLEAITCFALPAIAIKVLRLIATRSFKS